MPLQNPPLSTLVALPPPKLKDKLKTVFHYGLIGLALTPQILFAVGAVYPPAAAWAVALQNILSLGGQIQPGATQVTLAAAGAKLLRDTPQVT